MAIDTRDLTAFEVEKLLSKEEGHFLDMKAAAIKPARLTKSLSAFANADGGELFVGIGQREDNSWGWEGFEQIESANGHLQAFEEFFPLGQDFQYSFLTAPERNGYVLHILVLKTRDIKRASDGTPYLRRGAQCLPIRDADALQRLQRSKGVISFEDSTVQAPVSAVDDSLTVTGFMIEVVPNAEAHEWLAKQQLLVEAKPTVAACVLFADEPQIFLPKAGIKIYRYRTDKAEGTRDTLAFDPVTIEGPIYDQIASAVARTVELTEEIQIMREDGLQSIKYPRDALHEIITNAVLHRDYALNDDVHVRIFDNRIEVESPGRLPAHVTPQNILRERFARNPKIVRLINKFPSPPNKDVGEGLNTAFQAMQKLRLREPQILDKENSVLVNIRHEPLASPEQQIVDYIRENGTINNATAREVTGIESDRHVHKLFKKLVAAGEIEQVPGTFKATSAYRIPEGQR
jgi:ATP-dependent DNA helicase RecG